MSTRLWGLWGERARELLTYGGRVIAHPNREELAYLFPNSRIMEIPGDLREQIMPLTDHPDMHAVTFPLNRKDFRRER